MKITVIIPSRGRAYTLQDMLTTLISRASGKHEVSYVVGADADDPPTIALTYILRLKNLPVKTHCFVRSASLGNMVNEMALAEPADVYCSMGDDVEVLTQNWDERIYDAWTARPDGVWFWKCNIVATFAIVSEKWRAAAGRIFTDYFPFWWDDVWLIQVWQYAAGTPPLVVEAHIKDRGVATTRMRDLRFWANFYWSRGGERLAEAKRIAKTLGWPPVKMGPHLELNPHPSFVPENVEAHQGEKAPPTPEYLRAKSRVENMMKAA